MAKTRKDQLVTKENGRLSITETKWAMICDYLIEKEWNGADAYLQANPTTSREVAKVQMARLLTNDNFKKLLNDRIALHGGTKEGLQAWFMGKMDNAKVEANALRAAENVGKLGGLYPKEDTTVNMPTFNLVVKKNTP